jgi:hypothetical protein
LTIFFTITKMLRHCVVVLIFATLAESFVHHKCLTGTRPLSTASSGFQVSIPRLEPGLRVKKGSLLIDAEEFIQTIPSNPLNWLAQADAASAAALERDQLARDDLFRSATTAMNSITSNFMKYVRKIVASTLIIASSLSSAGMRKVAFANSVVAAITAAPRRVQASAIKKYNQLSPTQKLATTPLFFVCNSGGNPYLQDDIQSGKPEQRIIVYFMSSEDANDYLNEMAQGNPQNINEFRVMTTSMEKVVNKIQSRKQSRKLGRYKMSSIYRIQPSSRQCQNAEELAGKGDAEKGAEALQGISIPMFSAKGLAIKRANGEVVTPYYFALEDLTEDWSKLLDQNEESSERQSSKSSKGLPSKPKVEIRDFVEVMCLSQGLNSESLRDHLKGPAPQAVVVDEAPMGDAQILSSKQVKSASNTPGIVPPRREIEWIRRYYRNEGSVKNEFQQARM